MLFYLEVIFVFNLKFSCRLEAESLVYVPLGFKVFCHLKVFDAIQNIVGEVETITLKAWTKNIADLICFNLSTMPPKKVTSSASTIPDIYQIL